MVEYVLNQHIELQTINTGNSAVEAAVLRLDQLHPAISGNKWFKLKEYLADAGKHNINTIVTFGGAYSNHIIATAVACRIAGFQSIGIIRGERPKVLSHTLQNAEAAHMQLYFVSREDYKSRKLPQDIHLNNCYFIDEGGHGYLGMQGARDILNYVPSLQEFTHILSAVGTGTTLAGLIESTTTQQVIGISVMKNNLELETAVNELLSRTKKDQFIINHNYHMGGYAKHNASLISFMNEWYNRTGIPSDFVYTGKLFYAFQDLLSQNFFPDGSRVLLVHTGGLQGNQSLSKGTLIF